MCFFDAKLTNHKAQNLQKKNTCSSLSNDIKILLLTTVLNEKRNRDEKNIPTFEKKEKKQARIQN